MYYSATHTNNGKLFIQKALATPPGSDSRRPSHGRDADFRFIHACRARHPDNGGLFFKTKRHAGRLFPVPQELIWLPDKLTLLKAYPMKLPRQIFSLGKQFLQFFFLFAIAIHCIK